MQPSRRHNRRSFLARVAGGAFAAVGAGSAAGQPHGSHSAGQPAPPHPDKPLGCSDNDSGPRGDPVNRGRACRRLRQVDNDSGRLSDAPSMPPRRIVTDRDSGQYADPVGQGRGPVHAHGCSDTDGGPRADPGGGGRRC
jgi:hypothetical protein